MIAKTPIVPHDFEGRASKLEGDSHALELDPAVPIDRLGDDLLRTAFFRTDIGATADGGERET